MERHTQGMKINSALRFLVKLRVIIGCAAALAVVGLAGFVGVAVAAEIGQTTMRQTDGPRVPYMDFGDVMAAAR